MAPRARTKGRPDRNALGTAADFAADPSSMEESPGTLKLRNGIVLRIRPVTQMLIRDAMARIPKPTPPMSFNAQRGENIENPMHPDYLAAMDDYSAEQLLVAGNAALVVGTSVVFVPPHMCVPECDEWIEFARYAGGDIDEETLKSKPGRYLAWLHYHALESPTDISSAIMAPLLAASLSDEEVDRVVKSFRSSQERGADSERGAEEPDPDGDRVSEPVAGAGSGDGGA